MPAYSKVTYTSFDPAGSIDTEPYSISDSGSIAGDYEDSNEVVHGFVRAADCVITTFGVRRTGSTDARSINREGTVTGYSDDSFVRHAYEKARTFDPPGSYFSRAYSINRSGSIVGYYQDHDYVSHGFLRSPE